MNGDSFPLFGVSFCAARRKVVLERIRALARAGRSSSVVFANAHVIVEAQRQPALKAAMRRASLVIPDGVPVTWVLRGRGQSQAERYSGPDLMEDIFRAEPEASHFFLGSTPGTLGLIRRKFSGRAAGFYPPPFTSNGFSPGEIEKQLALIEKSRADFIWVGLGAPKQEYYVTEMAARASHGVWLGVGAAFDFYAGPKPRAPKFVQRIGMEWAFRLATEPRRLAWRYLSTNPAFIRLALKELLAEKDHHKAAEEIQAD